MLSDVVERLSDEGDGRLAASTLAVGLARPLQHGRVFPRQALRRAQLGLYPFTGHGKSFVQRCRDWMDRNVSIIHIPPIFCPKDDKDDL